MSKSEEESKSEEGAAIEGVADQEGELNENDLMPEGEKEEYEMRQKDFQEYFMQLQMTILQELGLAIKVLGEFFTEVKSRATLLMEEPNL